MWGQQGTYVFRRAENTVNGWSQMPPVWAWKVKGNQQIIIPRVSVCSRHKSGMEKWRVHYVYTDHHFDQTEITWEELMWFLNFSAGSDWLPLLGQVLLLLQLFLRRLRKGNVSAVHERRSYDEAPIVKRPLANLHVYWIYGDVAHILGQPSLCSG